MKAGVLSCVIAVSVAAQEIDTGNFETSRHSGSLLDRAETESERRDFAALQKVKDDPAKQRSLVDSFLVRYPGSWLLASIYQLGVAASLQLNDHRRVLADGRAALRLLPENPPMLLAVAQIELTMGHKQQAGRDARDAILWLSVFAPPAGVKAPEWSKTRQALDQSARLIIERAGGRPVKTEAPPKDPPDGVETFAGSEACKACHNAIFESWQKTGMAAMLRPVSGAKILADFSRVHEFRGNHGEVEVRIGGGDRPYFEFAQPGGTWKRFRVDFAVGSKWQQAYATRLPDERIFVFPVQYNALEKRWLNYWSMIDPPGSERARIMQFPRLSHVTSYQRNCAVCHTSQLRLMRLDDTMQHAAFHEPGINCEMCHGPSGRHVERMRAGEPEPAHEATPPFRFSRLNNREATLICGQCHRQSAMRNVGPDGEMNYTARKPYFTRLPSQPYAEFGSRAFYKDGRFRETTFIGESFMRSACFRRGTAQCASCHNPHPPDAERNQTSVKFRSNPDQMCLQCHLAIGAKLTAHTRHAAGSEGARCVSCHMPRIMNSLLFQARSHQIDDIPQADLTARFGQKDSPNACLICHREKDAGWVAGQLRNWNNVAGASAIHFATGSTVPSFNRTNVMSLPALR